MTRIRKINVSQIEGTNNGVLPAGTIVAYEVNGEYVLRVHDGVTAGGVSLNAGQTPIIFNGTDGIVVGNLNEGIAALFNNGDVYITGGKSLRFTGLDNIEGGSSAVLRFWNGEGRHSLDNDTTELVTLNVGNDADLGDPTLGFFKIITEKQVGGEKEWKFDASGNLTLPTSGDILNSAGQSVLGGTAANPNIWVQTFDTQDGAPSDIVAVATSVEYDADGNIIALFNHFDDNDGSSYYSVGKFTPTGSKVWTARFDSDFNTDGWGLAVGTNSIYVAGQTTATGPGYSLSTLTKIDATDGTIDWSKTYDFNYESASAVVDVAADGNPVMVGWASNGTDDYIATTKVDATTGDVIWSRRLNGQNSEQAYGMAVGAEGEIVVIGYMENLGANGAATELYAEPISNANWITDTSATATGAYSFSVSFVDGVPTFSNIVDLVGNRQVGDTLATVVGESFGGVTGVDDMVVKVGAISNINMDDRMIVVKYNSSGDIQWQKAVQFDIGYDCGGADADIDSEGNIYVVGEYDRDLNPGIVSALSIVKFDTSGTALWSRRVVGGCSAFGSSIVVGPDNKLYLSGVTQPTQDGNYIWVAAKYDFDGLVEWQRLIEHTNSWSFVGGNFFGSGGGSNIAVKQGYVVLAGGFGTFVNMEFPTATLVQVSAAGDVFSVGDWAFSPAAFSGTVTPGASDITVENAAKVDSDITTFITATTVTLMTEVSNFLLGEVYSNTTENRLVNGFNELVLGSTGTITLPRGGTITEGIVTSNPTIQLTPATPDVASQKLVIKGGNNFNVTDNGIDLGYSTITTQVGDTITFNVNSTTYANQTLYWWIYPEDAGIGDSNSGTVVLTDGYGTFSILIDSDDYEFTVRVSPEADNYDPANVGVESGLINASAPTFDSDHHLHLTTGDLTETSIFLGTDRHNVRTTTTGNIQVTTAIDNSNDTNVWTFDTTGQLQIPGSSNGRITEDEPGIIVYSDTGFAVQTGAGTPVADYEVQFTGYIDDGTGSGNAGSTLHITDIAAGTITENMTVYGAGLPPEGWELSFGSAVEPIGTGGIGTYVLAGANYLIASQSFNNNVAADLGPKNWVFDNAGELRFPDSTIQTTAYTGISTTVAKQASGIPQSFGLSTSNPSNFAPGSYPNILVGFDGKNLTLDIEIDEFYNISTLNIRNASPATFVISDSAILGGDLFGGTTPADDITITVSSIEPTAIDLTKTINKLADGDYSLADGVEGQIMYLVPQNDTVPTNVYVYVDHSRVAGTTGSGLLLPFRVYENSGDAFYDSTGQCTLIFTDGAWQQTGGAWD